MATASEGLAGDHHDRDLAAARDRRQVRLDDGVLSGDEPAQVGFRGVGADRRHVFGEAGGATHCRLDDDVVPAMLFDHLIERDRLTTTDERRRHHRQASTGEVDEIALVGVPSQQRCRVVHDRLLGVEMIQPCGERGGPLDVVPRRADDHDITTTHGIAPTVRPRSKTTSHHRLREHRVISSELSSRVVNRQQHGPTHDQPSHTRHTSTVADDPDTATQSRVLYR